MKFIYLTSILACSITHDFHVSVTQIDHNQGSQTLEIAIKMFTDDLEKVLETQGTPRLFLGAENEHEKTDEYLVKYVNTRFSLRVNGEEVALKFIGKEVENESAWSYFEVMDIDSVKTIEVTNRIMLETFDDHSNLVHLSVSGKKKSALLKIGHTSEVVRFD